MAPFRTFTLILLVSALFHVGVVILIGAPSGAALDGVPTPQALEVRLATTFGDGDFERLGEGAIETPPIPIAVAEEQGQVAQASFQGMERTLPDLKQEARSSRLSPLSEAGVDADVTESSVLDTDLALPKIYRSESELDFPPKALTSVLAEFPANASAENVHGKVVLMVLISRHGAVDDVKVLEGTPPGYFEASAVAAMRGMQFSPGQKSGHPVSSKLELTINYGIAVSQ
ncbi:MAG TPA: energy transducer TonB [Burkholderiales bacterium]|jgi:TonB family protein|nr:energy transducer TonB [Burkholderiales bacterium]